MTTPRTSRCVPPPHTARSTRRGSRLALLAASFVLGVSWACSTPNPPPPTVPKDGGGKADAKPTNSDGGSPAPIDSGTAVPGDGAPAAPMPTPQDPGPGPLATSVGKLAPSKASMESLALLQSSLAAVPKTAEELLTARAVSFLDKLPYAPGDATFLDKIQASKLALTPAELAGLQKRGFALSGRPQFLNFVHGYRAIYEQHLPVYVSADSILYALHRSYDAMLRTLEDQVLTERLTTLLKGMRGRLPATKVAGISAAAIADVDLHLAVALSLLTGQPAAPVAGGDATAIGTFVQLASADNGVWQKMEIFGQPRNIDFSQFKPRGHYTRHDGLKRYFRAMMWLGRIEFRLIETLETGEQVFQRRQVEGALLQRSLLDAPAVALWKSIDDVIRTFVGEPDDMNLPSLDAFVQGAGTGDPAALLAKDDKAIAQALIDGDFGAQRIASQIMVNRADKTLPLHRAFLLFGQRYVIDSHVFSNVVYARVKDGAVKRMMPNPLDAAFGALGNDAAVSLLAPELRKYDYATELAQVRVLADAHGADFWSSNLYNLWLSALRTMSPGPDLREPAKIGLPSVTATEPWSRRILNAQLGSWAELRHDTILYAKQSYTDAPACEYPDAYVDPYPELWGKLAELGQKGKAMVESLQALQTPQSQSYVTKVSTKLGRFAEVALLLKDMADRQTTGQPFTPQQMMFINQAVTIKPYGCAQSTIEGWYADSFFDPEDSVLFDPTIADVHTQPADEGGSPVGKVLHVGTGKPRLMVVTVDGCTGAKAYVGLASAYHETITSNFLRLDDPTWAQQSLKAEPADVPWMQELVGR